MKSIIRLIAVQCYIADCVSWVPRLTLLDLQTNWIYEHSLRMELVLTQGTYCRARGQARGAGPGVRAVAVEW